MINITAVTLTYEISQLTKIYFRPEFVAATGFIFSIIPTIMYYQLKFKSIQEKKLKNTLILIAKFLLKLHVQVFFTIVTVVLPL